jgi:Tfp pilus assembly protein FimV
MMAEDIPESDRRGPHRDRLDARIVELERQQEQLRERIKTLRARRTRLTSQADVERAVLDVLEDVAVPEAAAPGVPEAALLREMVARGWSEQRARALYEAAERRGLIFVVDGTVRVA